MPTPAFIVKIDRRRVTFTRSRARGSQEDARPAGPPRNVRDFRRKHDFLLYDVPASTISADAPRPDSLVCLRFSEIFPSNDREGRRTFTAGKSLATRFVKFSFLRYARYTNKLLYIALSTISTMTANDNVDPRSVVS